MPPPASSGQECAVERTRPAQLTVRRCKWTSQDSGRAKGGTDCAGLADDGRRRGQLVGPCGRRPACAQASCAATDISSRPQDAAIPLSAQSSASRSRRLSRQPLGTANSRNRDRDNHVRDRHERGQHIGRRQPRCQFCWLGAVTTRNRAGLAPRPDARARTRRVRHRHVWRVVRRPKPKAHSPHESESNRCSRFSPGSAFAIAQKRPQTQSGALQSSGLILRAVSRNRPDVARYNASGRNRLEAIADPTPQQARDVRAPTVPLKAGWLAVFLAPDATAMVTGAA
jgi:hypothetical protein